MAKTDTALSRGAPEPASKPKKAKPRWEPPGRLMLVELAMLSAGAGAIHLAVAADHFNYHWTHGAFFVAAGLAQLTWAVLVLAFPGRLLFRAGIAGNVLLIATWALSRTIGAPFGPTPWVPEPMGIEDGLATAFEVFLVVELLALVVGRGLAPRPARSAARFAPLAVLLILLTGGGIVSASIGGHSHGGIGDVPIGGGHHHSGSPIAPDDPLLVQIKAAIDEGGTVAGMDLLERESAQNHEVQTLAHQYVHSLGRYVYNTSDDPAAAFASCDMRFESGCYHGVLQGYFEDHPDFTGQDVAQLCSGPIDTDSSQNLKFQCLHGLGHGLTLFFDHNLLRPLRYCDFLADSWQRESCYGGVFMENIVWAQSGEALRSGLDGESVLPEDLQYPCDAVADKYKRACWFMQSSTILYLNGFDFGGAFAVCDQAPELYIDTCYRSMGRDIAGYTLQDPAPSLDLCMLGSPDRLSECLFGVAQTLINLDGTTDKAFEFCPLAPTDAQKGCYQAIGEFVYSLSGDPAGRRAECAKAPEPEWARVCEDSAQVRGPS